MEGSQVSILLAKPRLPQNGPALAQTLPHVLGSVLSQEQCRELCPHVEAVVIEMDSPELPCNRCLGEARLCGCRRHFVVMD